MPTNARKIEGYSDISEAVLAEESQIRSIANTDIEGVVGVERTKVFVNDLAAIADYVPGTGVDLTTDGSSFVEINNLKEKAVNEIVDGFTVETAPSDMVAKRFEAALAIMGETMDSDSYASMVADGTEDVASGDPAPTVDTIYQDILNLKLELDKQKVPRDGRSLIITPEMENLLLNQDSKIMLQTPRGDEIIVNGMVGDALGFRIYTSTLLPGDTKMIATHQRAFAFKENWNTDVSLVSLDNSEKFYGDSAIKGRMAYTYGAVRPELIRINNGAA